MKNLTQFLCVLFALGLSTLVSAQEEDSKYLVGAVPEVEGKVVFSKEYSIPGMSQEEIYDRVLQWMDGRLKKNENNSRVVFSDKAKGQIVGTGEEWIIFSSSALSLDRTKVLYQLSATCQPEKCTFEIEKIRFSYREGKEKYTAEEWIVDKYALNKTQDKLVRGLAKWRRNTVDFADELCLGVAEGLSAAPALAATAQKVEEKKPVQTVVAAGPVVITQKAQVVAIPATPLTPATKVEPAAVATPAQSYKEIAPAQLPTDAIQTGAGKLVVVIGQEPFNMTMMTANSGGSLGKVSGKPVVFSILSPDQPYEQLEKATTYTVRFYPAGQNEPTVVLECKKLPSPAAIEGMPRTYVGEIVKAMVK